MLQCSSLLSLYDIFSTVNIEIIGEKMNYFSGDYDVIVIGAGHAGCEAALAAA